VKVVENLNQDQYDYQCKDAEGYDYADISCNGVYPKTDEIKHAPRGKEIKRIQKM
jgi:hypothetical protein